MAGRRAAAGRAGRPALSVPGERRRGAGAALPAAAPASPSPAGRREAGRGGLAPVRPLSGVPGRRAAAPAGPAPSSRAGRARAAQPRGSRPGRPSAPLPPRAGRGAALLPPPPGPGVRRKCGAAVLSLGGFLSLPRPVSGLPAEAGGGCGALWPVERCAVRAGLSGCPRFGPREWSAGGGGPQGDKHWCK